MKKEYFKPEAEMLDITVETHILNDSYGGTVTPGQGPGAGGFGTNTNRGDWGNLWNNK